MRDSFWSEEWKPRDEDDGYGTALGVRAEVLDLGDSIVAALQVKIGDIFGDGESLATRLELADAEGLLKFLQARVPEMRRRAERKPEPGCSCMDTDAAWHRDGCPLALPG
jgi:hypothetical protein